MTCMLLVTLLAFSPQGLIHHLRTLSKLQVLLSGDLQARITRLLHGFPCIEAPKQEPTETTSHPPKVSKRVPLHLFRPVTGCAANKSISLDIHDFTSGRCL